MKSNNSNQQNALAKMFCIKFLAAVIGFATAVIIENEAGLGWWSCSLYVIALVLMGNVVKTINSLHN